MTLGAPPVAIAPARNRWLRAEWLAAALVGLVALIVLRPASLSTPFWWDAGAVYAPGASWLAQHGFDARPGVFPSDLSRGHTPGFYLVIALAFRAFGAGPASGHAPVLLFGALALAWTYSLGKTLFGRPAGTLAAALLVISPLFLTMSSDTLPEIPITALTVASLDAFARGRRIESAAWGCVLVAFKETGVACPLAIAASLAVEGLRTRDRSMVRQIAIASAPLAVLVVFFAWQKLAEGWFVLPYHADLFREHHSLVEQGVHVVASIVAFDGRWIALGMFALVAGLRLAGHRRVYETDANRMVLLAMLFIVVIDVVFFAKMFFLDRYALPAHPCVLILMAGALVPPTFERATMLRTTGAVLMFFMVSTSAFRNRYAGTGYDSGETTFRYLHAVNARRAIFRVLDAQPRPPAVLTAWPGTDEVREPYLGWVSRRYRAVNWDHYSMPGHDRTRDGPIDAVIVAEGLGGHSALRTEAVRLGLHLAAHAQEGGAVVELWLR